MSNPLDDPASRKWVLAATHAFTLVLDSIYQELDAATRKRIAMRLLAAEQAVAAHSDEYQGDVAHHLHDVVLALLDRQES